jgi:signal transduction histidine kinase/ActR/RegA family two-component response regulator
MYGSLPATVNPGRPASGTTSAQRQSTMSEAPSETIPTGKAENHDLTQREHLAALISEVSTAVVRTHDLQDTLARCCESIVRHLDAALARIWVLDKGANVLVLQASAGIFTQLADDYSRVPVGQLKVGRIALEHKPYLTNDLVGESKVSEQEWARRQGIVAFAGYPLLVESRLLGVIALFAREPLTRTVLQALEVVADGIALRIERYQAETRLREQTEVVETINRIGRLLSAELDQQNLVQAVTDAATELTGASFGSFFYNVFNEEGASYMLYTLSGVPREAFENFPMPRATKLFGPTFRGEGTIRIHNVKEDSRYGHSAPYHGMPPGHLPVVSYLAVPVVSRSGEVIGGLFFGHSEAGVFTERHERIVEGLAAQTAIAMDNARLYQSAQRGIREKEALLASEQAARKEAEIASRAKDEFLGLLSHELRNPLNAILGWTRLLNTDKVDAKMFSRGLETIDRNAKLQSRLIEDMLDVSRIVSGKLRLDAHPVDLTSVINAAVDTSRPAADAKDIRIHVILDFGAGMVLGDPVRLQQIVWNLLSNAIKFTPKHGRVYVQLERINSHVEVTVSDTGPGIDADFLPYVFERFRQADSTTTKKYGGLGLGLSIVRHLVELHGGTIEAGNRDGSQGAVFTMKLPILAVRKAPGLDAEPERVHSTLSGALPLEPPPALHGIKVLAVDDEADARFLLTTVLEQCGAEVRTCASAAEALAALEEFEPDVLVSDIGMPEESGYDLIRKIRAGEAKHGRWTPAVALTAYARAEDRLQALKTGYNMHVPKPVEPAELAVVIASLTQVGKKT